MADFSNATITLRRPMVPGPANPPRMAEFFERRARLCSSSWLSNPILAGSKLADWPDEQLIARLEEECLRNLGAIPALAYFQIAFPLEDAPVATPRRVILLGYDVTDGSDSYLVDYGVRSPALHVPASRLNEVGLLGRAEAASLALALTREWSLPPGGAQIWALFESARSA